MATFSAQVVDLVGTFSDETALDTFITEGANEVINAMPRAILERVAEETSVTDGTTTSEGHKILYVLRNDGTIDQPCRLVPAFKRGRIQDSSDMEFATTSDPAYYIQDGKINIFPNGNGLMVSVPTYSQSSPLDASGISTITNFPDEYEYLVTLYAAIKALNQNLSALHSNSDITTALTAINTEIDETLTIADLINTQIDDAVTEIAETVANVDANVDTALAAMTTAAGRINTAVGLANNEFDKGNALLLLGEADTESDVTTALTAMKAAVEAAEAAFDKMDGSDESVFGDEDTFLTASSQLTRVKAAIDNAENLINNNQPSATTDAFGAQANEDIELVTSALNIAQTEIQRSQAHLSEWTAIGDMRIKQINASLSEANGYGSEIQARLAQAQAKREESNSRIQLGNSYLAEANAAASEVQAFGNEVSQRLAQVGAQGNVAASYINAATGYANEIQSKLNIASAYGNEVQLRLNVDSTEYQWYERQQAKLQADYDKGIQLLRGA